MKIEEFASYVYLVFLGFCLGNIFQILMQQAARK